MWGFESLRPCHLAHDLTNVAYVVRQTGAWMKDTKEMGGAPSEQQDASAESKERKRMKNTVAANAEDQPERRKSSAEGGALSSVGSWPKQTKTFLEDVRSETRRVTWPTWKQVQATTIVVIVTVAFFAAYLGALDTIYTRLLSWVLRGGQ